MRFCIVTPFFPSSESSGGGVGTHYYDLTCFLAPFCEEIILVFVSDRDIDDEIKETLPDNITIYNIKDGFSKIPGDPFSLPTKIRKRISRLFLNIKVALHLLFIDRTKRIDILETTNYLYLCLFYSFLPNRKPLITRFSSSTGQLRQYGNWRSSKLDLIEQLEIWMFKRSSVKLSHTHQHGQLIAKQMGLSNSEIAIIPHGTSIAENVDSSIEERPSSDTTVLFLGRLEMRKGIRTFLESIPELIKRQPALKFRIAGHDTNDHHQKVFLDETPELAPYVTFLGEISHEEKIQEYKNCDIFAAPSLYESFGLIYVEAMSFSKPVIGCRAGGTIEVIKDKEVGYLIEPGSVEELTEAIHKLARDPDLRQQMGSAAKERVERLFTAKTMARNSYRALEAIQLDWNYRL